jgi:hypothetical protein
MIKYKYIFLLIFIQNIINSNSIKAHIYKNKYRYSFFTSLAIFTLISFKYKNKIYKYFFKQSPSNNNLQTNNNNNQTEEYKISSNKNLQTNNNNIIINKIYEKEYPEEYNNYCVISEKFTFDEISNRAKKFFEIFYKNLYEIKSLNKYQQRNALFGGLTFLLPVIFINFEEFKNKKSSNLNKNDITTSFYAYCDFLKNEEINSQIISFLILNNKNIDEKSLEKILDGIHFQYGNEDYPKKDIDYFFRDHVFYSTYNFLVEAFFKAQEKNKLNLFYQNAFDFD